MDFFDPIGYATSTPQGKIAFYREVELKHGRVAMLAALGFIVGENFHPLFGGDIDVPGIYAFQETPLQTFWPAVVAAIANQKSSRSSASTIRAITSKVAHHFGRSKMTTWQE